MLIKSPHSFKETKLLSVLKREISKWSYNNLNYLVENLFISLYVLAYICPIFNIFNKTINCADEVFLR